MPLVPEMEMRGPSAAERSVCPCSRPTGCWDVGKTDQNSLLSRARFSCLQNRPPFTQRQSPHWTGSRTPSCSLHLPSPISRSCGFRSKGLSWLCWPFAWTTAPARLPARPPVPPQQTGTGTPQQVRCFPPPPHRSPQRPGRFLTSLRLLHHIPPAHAGSFPFLPCSLGQSSCSGPTPSFIPVYVTTSRRHSWL